ncbi:P97 family adhesin [Mesomycoplasma conjunctivae]|uniref:P97 family adhesin n=1 Tax=Mesomycoplasma conjunctivae TaxID=45361 RepID=UPI003DA4C638
MKQKKQVRGKKSILITSILTFLITGSILGGSIGIAYGLAYKKNNDYQKNIDFLNSTLEKIRNVSFHSSKITPFSNYASLKQEWNEINDLKQASQFFNLQILKSNQLVNFEIPKEIQLTYTKVEPNDDKQHFDVEFYLSIFNGSKEVKTKIQKTSVAIDASSAFFLSNFVEATQIALASIQPYQKSSDNASQNVAAEILANDFATFVNDPKTVTSDDAIEKINTYFNLKNILNSALKNSNFAIKYKGKFIHPYQIELLQIAKSDDKNIWVETNEENADIFNVFAKISFSEQAKSELPQTFDTNLTKTISFRLLDNKTRKPAFISTQEFISKVTINSPTKEQYYLAKTTQNSQAAQTLQAAGNSTPTDQTTDAATEDQKVDILDKDILDVYKLIKYDKGILNSPEKAKKHLLSFLNQPLEIDFSQQPFLAPQVRKRFDYYLLPNDIRIGTDEESSFIRVPLKITYKTDPRVPEKLVEIFIRHFKNSDSLLNGQSIEKNKTLIPQISYQRETQNSDTSVVLKAREAVAKAEILSLLEAKKNDQLFQLITDRNKFNYKFSELELLNAWVSNYQLPSINDFLKQTLLPTLQADGSLTKPLFRTDKEFSQFSQKIIALGQEAAKLYLDHILVLLDLKKASENNDAKTGEAEVQQGSQTDSQQPSNSTGSSADKTLKEKLIEGIRKLEDTFSLSSLDPLITYISSQDKISSIDDFTKLFFTVYGESDKNSHSVDLFDNFAQGLKYQIQFYNLDETQELDNSSGSSSDASQNTAPSTPVAPTPAAPAPAPAPAAPTPSSASTTSSTNEIIKIGYYFVFFNSDNSKIAFQTKPQKLELQVSSLNRQNLEKQNLANSVVLNFPSFAKQLETKLTLDEFKKKFNSTKQEDAKEVAKLFKEVFGLREFMSVYPLLKGFALTYPENGYSTNALNQNQIKFEVVSVSEEDYKQIIDINRAPTVQSAGGGSTGTSGSTSAQQPSQGAGGTTAPGASGTPGGQAQASGAPAATQSPTSPSSQPSVDPSTSSPSDASSTSIKGIFPLIFTVQVAPDPVKVVKTK